jgi:hypothetical protein
MGQDVWMRWPLVSLILWCACAEPFSPPRPAPDAGPSNVAGMGSGPCFAATPPMVDFGEIETGSTASTFVRITNLTTRFLKLDAPQPDGPFSVEPVPIVGLSPDASTQLQLHFAPPDALLHFGSLAVSIQDGGCALDIPLRGLGAGTLAVTPGSLDFGPVEPGQSKSLELIFTNTFRSPVVFDPIQLMPEGGGTVSAFTLDFPTPLTIPPVAVTAVTITARPIDYDEYHARLLLTGSTAARTIFLTVAGGVPIGSLSPRVIDVPKMEVSNFIERSVWLRNDATQGSLRSGLQFVQPFIEIRTEDGGLTSELRIDGLFDSLRPGEKEEVSFLLMPNGVGLHRYQLTFFTNDPAHPELHVELNANALELPPCSVARPSQVQLTPLADGGSIGVVRFTNSSAGSCVLDTVRLARSNPPVFRIIDGGVDQVEIAPGGVHEVWISGPDAGTGNDAGTRWSSALWFHVLNPGRSVETIDLFAPP